MTYVPSVTEDQIMTTLVTWIMTALAGQVAQGWANRVATPTGDFVIVSGLVKARLSQHERSHVTPVFPATVGSEVTQQTVDYHVQLDCYGQGASDNAFALSTAFASDRACDFFTAQLPGLAPLFCEDPRQLPITNGEQQYEDRWTIVAHLQCYTSISDAQESATSVSAGVINVDAEYSA